MKTNTTLLTEDEFISRFEPENELDCYYTERHWGVPKDTKSIEDARENGRIWTALEDSEGNWCLMSGYHWINRLYYVICKNPVQDNEEFIVLDVDGWEKESSRKLVEHVRCTHSDAISYKDHAMCGGKSTDHVYWHAANILGITNKLPNY